MTVPEQVIELIDDPEKAALKHAIELIGGPKKAAEIWKMSPRNVYKMLKRGHLPRTEYTGETEYAEALANASNGQFSAEWLLTEAKPSRVSPDHH